MFVLLPFFVPHFYQQKKQMLEQSLQLQTQESCTFAPKFYTSSIKRNAAVDNRPVSVRLYESSKMYQESHEKRLVQFSTYDDDGNRLFVPRINRKGEQPSTPLSSHGRKPGGEAVAAGDSSVISQASNIGADEFLYQDAKDRELRHQIRLQSYEQELSKESQKPKINSTSEKMLRRKMVSFSLLFAALPSYSFLPLFLSFSLFIYTTLGKICK
jgi:hypothetical protein